MKQPYLWEQEFEYRRTLLKVLLLIIIAVGCIFAIHNWLVGLYTLAITEIVTVCFAVVILCIHKTTKNINFWAASFLAVLYLIIIFGIYSTLFSASLYAWLFIIPVLSYLLLGLKLGSIMTAIFTSAGLTVFYITHVTNNADIPFISILNISFCIIAIWSLSYTYEYKRASMNKKLQDVAALDPLTNLNNRLNLEAVFSSLCKQSGADKNGLAMLLLDLDYFKKINDKYGHAIGDKVLKEVAIRLTDIIDVDDWAFRLGGEEFCLLVNHSNTTQTTQVAEILRENIMADMEIDTHILNVKVSIGVAHWPNDGSNLAEIYQIADKRLYKAKRLGRNIVVNN